MLALPGRHFFSRTGGAWMSANDGRVNEQMLHVCIISQFLMQLMEDALLAPTSKASVDGVPVAVLFGKQSPLRTGARHPQNGREKAAAFMLLSDIGVGMSLQNGQHLLPLFIR